MWYNALKPLLFSISPEKAHDLSIWGLKLMQSRGLARFFTTQLPFFSPIELFGCHFPNPVGLAAGLDKNGQCVDAFLNMGFGFVEVGTVTPKAQPGNPKPRLFRIKEAKGLINRMGFNNQGLERMAVHLKARRHPGLLGVNLGKNLKTPNERAYEDYLLGFEAMHPFADYMTVNLSSPNTPGLTDLQKSHSLIEILEPLKEKQQTMAQKARKRVPFLVKLSPDLNREELEAIGQILLGYDIDGVIATNTSIWRQSVKGLSHAHEKGGLSGEPIQYRSTRVIQSLSEILNKQIPIIGVGGICSPQSALDKIKAGASLIQIYTGLMYKGPSLVSQLIQSLDAYARENGPWWH